jgi:hypothetical protein
MPQNTLFCAKNDDFIGTCTNKIVIPNECEEPVYSGKSLISRKSVASFSALITWFFPCVLWLNLFRRFLPKKVFSVLSVVISLPFPIHILHFI